MGVLSSTSSSGVNGEPNVTGAGVDVFSVVVAVASCSWIVATLLGGEDITIGDLMSKYTTYRKLSCVQQKRKNNNFLLVEFECQNMILD